MYKRKQSWYADFFHEGERYRKSLGKVSRSVAKERELSWKIDVRNGKYAQRLRRISFDTLAEKVIEWGRANRKPNTVHRYHESRVKLRPHFGGKPIAAITAELAEQFKKKRLQETTKPRRQKNGTLKPGKPIAPATVNRELDFLRLSIRKAVEWGYLAFNPLSTVKHLTEDNERMWVLTSEEEQKLLQACDNSRQRTKYLRDMVELALNTGMRLNELQGLKKASVHLRKRFVALTGTKNHDSRNVPLNDRALEILQRRMAGTPSEYILARYCRKIIAGRS